MAISDTSPICYLVLIDEIEALHRVCGRVHIPVAVHRELNHSRAPERVRAWLGQLPDWLSVDPLDRPVPPELEELHSGERQVILLAEAINDSRVVLDELRARKLSKDRGLRVTGLLGILARDAELGHSDLRQTLAKLQETTFHIAPSLLAQVMGAAGR